MASTILAGRRSGGRVLAGSQYAVVVGVRGAGGEGGDARGVGDEGEKRARTEAQRHREGQGRWGDRRVAGDCTLAGESSPQRGESSPQRAQRTQREEEGGLGEPDKLDPLTEAGTGFVREPERAYMRELIERVNALFEGELTDQDKLVYVNRVLLGKLLESETLIQQAASNSKEQFASSPDLKSEILNAIMSALDAHNVMSTQALNSEAVRAGLTDILLNHSRLWEHLRARVGT